MLGSQMGNNDKDVRGTPLDVGAATEAATNELPTFIGASASNSKQEINAITREISARDAYFASLNEWVKHANISQNAMALFPWYLLSSYSQIFQNQSLNVILPSFGTATGAEQSFQNNNNINNRQMPNATAVAAAAPLMDAGGFRILDDEAQAEIINRNGGFEYVIAPFWKRAIAEVIDIFILLLLKIIVTFTIMNLFNLNLNFDLDKAELRRVIDDEDYTTFLAYSLDFLAFSSDLLLLELLTKVIVCFYEAIWSAMHNGSTPGKAIMHIRIIYVEAVVPIQPQLQQPHPQLGFQGQRIQLRALIYPAVVPSLIRAFMRAIAKNLIMTLLFPMCFIMIFFKNNRTAYDIFTKTMVVENSANPVFRRQRGGVNE